MSDHKTSWEDLWRKTTAIARSKSGTELHTAVSAESSTQDPGFVSLYRDACNRKKGDPGFEPPPPPAGARPNAKPPPPPPPPLKLNNAPGVLPESATEAVNPVDTNNENAVSPIVRPAAPSFLSGIAAFDRAQLNKCESGLETNSTSTERRFCNQTNALIEALDRLRLCVDPDDIENDDDETNWDD